MVCSTGLDLLQSSGRFPCLVCHKEWATTASTAPNFDNRCEWCRGNIDGRSESA